MRVLQLELHDVPGIDARGLTLDGLDAPVVLLLGPNGSGKSTARRCLEQLLFESHRSLINAHIIGTFALDDETVLHAEQRHGNVVWTRDGVPTTPPSLPSTMYSECYAISAHALLAAGGTEQGFAATVRREMSGGYDVAVIREDVSAGALAQQFGLARSKEVTAAKKDLRELEGDLDALAGDEDRLGGLRAEMAAADEASTRRTELREKLGEFQRAQESESPLALRAQKSARVIATLDTQRTELDAAGPLPPADRLATAVRLASELQALDGDMSRAKEDLARARATEDAARGDLEGVDAGNLRVPTPADLDAIQSAWAAASALRSQLSTVDKALSLLPEEGSDAQSVRSLDAALDELNRWLANAPRASTRRHPALVPAALALLVLSAIAAVLLSPWLIVGAGLGAAWLAALLLGSRDDSVGSDTRDRAAAAFERSGCTAPSEWEAGNVESLVRELRDERETASRLEQGSIERARLEGDRAETQAKLRSHEGILDTLSESLGLASGSGGLDLTVLARRVLAFDSAELATASATGALESQRDRRAEVEARAMAALGLDDSTPIDPAAMHQRVAALQERATKLESLSERRKLEVERHAEASEAHEEQRRLIGAAAAALGVEPDVSFTDAQAFFALENQTLDSKLEGRDQLLRLIERIETQLKGAREKGAWEEALASRSTFEEELTEAFSARVDALCAGALLDDVETEYERASRPAVLERSAALFAGFTHERYDLVALQDDDGEARFAANDVDSGEQRSLTELSDGTRMQLLLALRIAFAEHHERGEAVPLVLDEAFSMSDRARVFAMVEAVGHLAREGRQILYLGADDALEAEWNAIASQAGHEAPRVIRIAGAQRSSRSVSAPAELTLAFGPDVPDPERFTPEDYGVTIGVGLLDPHDDAGSLHLFHLLRDDLPTLARLLRQRIGTLGRWEALVGRGGDVLAIGGAEAAAQLTARAAAARALVEAWHVSHGFPVGRAQLEASNAVSDTYLDKMSEYLADIGGDAQVLFAELEKPGGKRDLRVKGFRGAKITELRTYLLDIGALDLRPPLSAEEQDEKVREAAPTLDAVGAVQLAVTIRAQLERVAVTPVS